MMRTKRFGHVFKRGEIFYCRWMMNGRLFQRALRDAEGNPARNRKDAEQARDRLMAPFRLGDETAALEALSGMIAGRKAEAEQIKDQENPPLKVEQSWRSYLDSPVRPDSGNATLNQYASHWKHFSKWLKAEHRRVVFLRDVTTEIAREYAVHMHQRGLSPNRYNKSISFLRLLFRVLKEPARITANPWLDIQRKKQFANRRRELTIDELRRVCSAATGEMRMLFALGLYTGMRFIDCCTLRWCEVDLHRRIIRRVPSKTALRNNRPVLIPIHPALDAILQELAALPRGEYVMPCTAESYKYDNATLSSRVQEHFRNCGLSVYRPGTGKGTGRRAIVEVSFHSLRHTFVSMCRDANAPLAVVEAIVGHTSAAMTQYYTHVSEAAAVRAVAALPSILETPPASPPPDPATVLRQVQEAVGDTSSANWQEERARIVEILAQIRNELPA